MSAVQLEQLPGPTRHSRLKAPWAAWALAALFTLAALLALAAVEGQLVVLQLSTAGATWGRASLCLKVPAASLMPALVFRDYCAAEGASGDSSAAPAMDEWLPCSQLARLQQDGNIVVTSANHGYRDFAVNLWRQSQRVGRTNVLLVADDCKTYRFLIEAVGADHVAKPLFPPANAVSKSAMFNTEEFRQVTKNRPFYLKAVLAAGYNVLWQDVDSVPMADAFAYLPQKAIAVDVVVTGDGKVPTAMPSLDNDVAVCSCFIYLTAGRPGGQWLLDRWLHHLESECCRDQPAFNHALMDALDEGIYGSNNFTHVVLPTRLFPNGYVFNRYAATALWCHANWLFGRANKMAHLKRHGLWDADVEVKKKEEKGGVKVVT